MKATFRIFLPVATLILTLLTTPLHAASYYWVGGSGNWADYNAHWATHSGGQIFWNHAPTPNDTVIFDTLSFNTSHDTVYAAHNSMYCYSMKWMHIDSLPVFTNDTSTSVLRIYGSLLLDSTTQWQFTGELIFCSTTIGNTITSCGKQLNYALFNGDTSATWTLTDTLRVARLIFRSGRFYSGGQTIITTIYEQDYTNYSEQHLDTSTVFCQRFRNHSNPVLFDAAHSTVVLLGDSLWGGGLTFGKVTITGRAGITGNNSIDTLDIYNSIVLGGSNTIGTLRGVTGIIISLMPNTITTITDTMMYSGGCRGMSAFLCADINASASVDFQFAGATADNLFAENVNATGNGAIINNGIANNSTGWTMTNVPSPRNLYWVNGAGNWSDTAHWSLTSGSNSGECAPTPIDNVTFDANSFSTSSESVLADEPAAFCDDMSWSTASGTPSFQQPGGTLLCYGALNIPNPLSGFQTALVMRSMNANTPLNIPGASPSEITFDGHGGWNQSGSLSTNLIIWSNGDYKSSGNPMGCSQALFVSHAVDHIDLSGSYFSAPDYFMFASPGYFFAPDTLFTAYMTDGNTHIYHDVESPSGLVLSANCSFETVNVLGDLSINGSNSFDTLRDSGNEQRIVLGVGTTQTINGDLQIFSSCLSPVAMESSYSGGTAYISKSSGTINCDYLVMQDIHAIGGATFNATNTCATYNVSGWNVTPPPSTPLYWIGGSGSWKDPNHWSLTSGGAPYTCIPNPLTDVFFDANSFPAPSQNVLVDARNAYCHTMDWTGATGNPDLSSPIGNTLFCYGSLSLEQGVNSSGLDLVLRSHTTGNTINPQSAVMGLVTFDGIAGDWSLANALQCDSIHLINGAFFTLGNTLTTHVMRSDTTCSRELHLDSSIVYTNKWIIADDTAMILDASTAEITIDGDRFTGGNDRNYFHVNLQNGAYLTDRDTFHELTTYGDCRIENEIVVDTLRLNSAGGMITLQSGDTVFVDSALFAGGMQSSFVGIECSDPIEQSFIVKTTDTVCIEYMILRGISASGGATFYAGVYSTDVDNNSGWVWFNCNPQQVNVWPGDANYDLVADNYDILSLGIAYGETGGVRPSASLNWIAQPNDVWSRTFADSTDIVHADCDGDGIIGQSDTAAVSLNYGLNHPARLAAPEQQTQTSGAEIKTVITQALYQPGDTVEIPIWLGTQNNPVANGYGAAFTLNWDQPFVEPGTMQFDYGNSWFTPPSNNIHLEKPFTSALHCDFGICRTSHSDTSGGGELVMMRFVLAQNASGPLKFWFTDYKMIDHNEDTLSMISTGGTINAAVGIDEVVTPEVSAFPNPASDVVSVYSNLTGAGYVEVYDAAGRMVFASPQSDLLHVELNIAFLESGFYTMVVRNDSTRITCRLQKI